MPLINNNKTFRIDRAADPQIVEGEWYEIREEWTWQQIAKTRLDQAMQIKLSDDTKKGIAAGDANAVAQTMDFGFDTSEINLEKLKLGVIRWSHKTGEGGQFVPINGQTLSQLDFVTCAVLVKHINAAIERSKKRGTDNVPLPNASES